MRYDLTDLRLFVHVGEAGNLTRAAERTFLSLPAASARVRQLEDAFKTPLLVRQATGVSLTPAGEVLLRHAHTVLRQLECMNADLQPYGAGIKGRLRLLANTTATHSFLADAMSTFLASHPDVDIELEERVSGDIVHALRAGSASLGIVAGHVNVDGLDVMPLFRDELAIVTALGHPLAGQASVAFGDVLDTCQFVGIHPNSAIQTFLEDIAASHGKRLCQRVHVGSFEAVCRMVEAGAGIAVVPLACVARYGRLEALHIVRIDDDWALRERLLCRPRGGELPQFVEAFIGHVQTAAQQAGTALPPGLAVR